MKSFIFLILLFGKINLTYAYEVYDSTTLNKILAFSSEDFDGLSLIKDFQKKSLIPFNINITKSLESTQLSNIKIDQEIVTLNLNPNALKNPWVTKEIIEEMRGLHLLHQQTDFYMYKELLLNSEFGDTNAKRGLVAFEETAVYRAHNLQNSPRVFDLIEGSHPQSNLEDYLHLRISDLVERRKSIDDLSKVKVDISKLNQDIFSEVKDLALNNDRKGVAKLLNSSISWNLLTESEKRAYKDFISSIENPSKDKVVLLRGLGKDQEKALFGTRGYFSKSVQNGVLDEEISVFRNNSKFSDFYLPDLESRKWKWSHVDSFVAGARLHGTYANTTPYISTTSSLDTALSFSAQGHPKSSQRRVLLIEVDQTRLLPNIFSQFEELEYLVPFLIFPDEIKEDITGTDAHIRQRITDYKQKAKATFIDDSASSFEKRGRLLFQNIQSCNWLLR